MLIWYFFVKITFININDYYNINCIKVYCAPNKVRILANIGRRTCQTLSSNWFSLSLKLLITKSAVTCSIVCVRIHLRIWKYSPLYLPLSLLLYCDVLIWRRSVSDFWSKSVRDQSLSREELISRYLWNIWLIGQWPHHRLGREQITITSSSFSLSATAVSRFVIYFCSSFFAVLCLKMFQCSSFWVLMR